MAGTLFFRMVLRENSQKLLTTNQFLGCTIFFNNYKYFFLRTKFTDIANL